MDLPMIAPAPFIAEHTQLLHDLFENPRQFRHCQPYLTSLMGLPENSLAHSARGLLDSADKPNRSRCFSEAPWRGRGPSPSSPQVTPHAR